MRGRLRTAWLGALLTAVVSLTACGGGGDGGGDGGEPAGERSAAATGGEAGSDPDQESDQDAGSDPDAEADAEAETGGPDGADAGTAGEGVQDETVPEDELTPQEGEFTEEQRDFLTDRVPAGADPGAILEVGDEACYRIGYLERVDREAALTALRDGEIPSAEAAVEHLCPEYAELLAEARE
ncbi:hypothetical protein [Streptomyces mayteni]